VLCALEGATANKPAGAQSYIGGDGACGELAPLWDQDDFVRQLRKFARKANTVVVVDKTKGKGSHARVKYVLG
jgi:hypothetical protein